LREDFAEAPYVGCFNITQDLKNKKVTVKNAYCKVGKLSGKEKGTEIAQEWTPLCYAADGT